MSEFQDQAKQNTHISMSVKKGCILFCATVMAIQGDVSFVSFPVLCLPCALLHDLQTLIAVLFVFGSGQLWLLWLS